MGGAGGGGGRADRTGSRWRSSWLPTVPWAGCGPCPGLRVYQVVKKLVQLGLIAERSTERSDRGPVRTIVAITPAGGRALRRWLEEPVDHVRDVRSMLLLKLGAARSFTR